MARPARWISWGRRCRLQHRRWRPASGLPQHTSPATKVSPARSPRCGEAEAGSMPLLGHPVLLLEDRERGTVTPRTAFGDERAGAKFARRSAGSRRGEREFADLRRLRRGMGAFSRPSARQRLTWTRAGETTPYTTGCGAKNDNHRPLWITGGEAVDFRELRIFPGRTSGTVNELWIVAAMVRDDRRFATGWL